MELSDKFIKSLQPYNVNLWYFILRLFDLKESIAWNIKGLRHWVAKIANHRPPFVAKTQVLSRAQHVTWKQLSWFWPVFFCNSPDEGGGVGGGSSFKLPTHLLTVNYNSWFKFQCVLTLKSVLPINFRFFILSFSGYTFSII